MNDSHIVLNLVTERDEARAQRDREAATFLAYRGAVTAALGIDPASCAEDVAQEAGDALKSAALHRKLNERVAGALGLLEMRKDPETGEEYLPSWHDMPEKVTALRAELRWHEAMNGTRAEQEAEEAAGDRIDADFEARRSNLTQEQIDAEMISIGLDPESVRKEAVICSRLVVKSLRLQAELAVARRLLPARYFDAAGHIMDPARCTPHAPDCAECGRGRAHDEACLGLRETPAEEVARLRAELEEARR